MNLCSLLCMCVCFCREVVSRYSIEVRELGFIIEELILESLGLEKDYMRKVFGE